MKKIKISRYKYKAISMISGNFSEVFLGSLVLPVFLGGLDSYRGIIIVFGLLGVIVFVIIAIISAEKGKL